MQREQETEPQSDRNTDIHTETGTKDWQNNRNAERKKETQTGKKNN